MAKDAIIYRRKFLQRCIVFAKIGEQWIVNGSPIPCKCILFHICLDDFKPS